MPNPTQSPIADLRVVVNNARLPAAAHDDLLSVTVQDDIEAPSMFTLKLMTWDERRGELSWTDDDLFALGGEVEISLGYVGNVMPVLKGDITGIELEVSAGEVSVLIVRGYDRRHRLLRGNKTRSFVQMKDSDIAAQIAEEQGLTPDAVDSTVTLEYVLQHAQADLDFLKERAVAIGYEVVVAGGTLHFRPHRTSAKAAISLRLDQDMIDFYTRITTRGQAGQVVVRGWDPKEKKPIVGAAQAGQKASVGATSGPAAADKLFGATTLAYVERPVFKQEEAEQIALRQLEKMALGFVTGEGTCFGRADLKAGSMVDIQGAGKRFSGKYYVMSSTHSYSPTQGYRTQFTARRNET